MGYFFITMLDLGRFKVLTFDCYGTLIDWETGIFSALRPILAAHGKSITDSALLEMYSTLEAEAEQGEFQPYRKVLQSVIRGFGQRLGFTPTPAEMRSLPESLATWRPFPDTVPSLLELKKHHQLAVISNVDDDLFAAAFRASSSVRLVQTHRAASDGWQGEAQHLAVDGGFRWSLPCDDVAATLVAACDGSRPLAAIAAVLGLTTGLTEEDLTAALPGLVRGLVDRGVLLPPA